MFDIRSFVGPRAKCSVAHFDFATIFGIYLFTLQVQSINFLFLSSCKISHNLRDHYIKASPPSPISLAPIPATPPPKLCVESPLPAIDAIPTPYTSLPFPTTLHASLLPLFFPLPSPESDPHPPPCSSDERSSTW